MKKTIIKISALLLCICFLFTGCSSISIGTFMGIEGNEIEYEIKNGEATVVGVPNKATITEINIPDEIEGVPVTQIADFSVVNLEYVNKVTIGKNVKEIGGWAFSNNQHVTEIKVHKENVYFCDVDGVVFSKDMKTLLFYPLAKDIIISKDENGNEIKLSEYSIPEGVETIRTKAFYKCGVLTRITLPDSLKFIEEKAFFRCGSLKNVILPQGFEFLGKDAFAYCTGLTEINIPGTTQEIQEYAFYNCTNLLTVNIDREEEGMRLGEKWYPTKNGLGVDGLNVSFKN